MTNHETDIPRPSHWPCPSCGVQTHPHDPDCPVLAHAAEINSREPALRWQTESPTEPVKHCLVKFISSPWPSVFEIDHSARLGGLSLWADGFPIALVSEMSPGTQYCPLPITHVCGECFECYECGCTCPEHSQ